MRKFKVYVGTSEIWYQDVIVEAESESQAEEKAKNMDGEIKNRKHYETDFVNPLEIEEIGK